jgi:hypothetical protein
MMATDKAERIKSIIGWMRKNTTLSLDNHRLGRGKASKIRLCRARQRRALGGNRMSSANHMILVAGMGTSPAVLTETVWERDCRVRFRNCERVVDAETIAGGGNLI